MDYILLYSFFFSLSICATCLLELMSKAGFFRWFFFWLRFFNTFIKPAVFRIILFSLTLPMKNFFVTFCLSFFHLYFNMVSLSFHFLNHYIFTCWLWNRLVSLTRLLCDYTCACGCVLEHVCMYVWVCLCLCWWTVIYQFIYFRYRPVFLLLHIIYYVLF